MNSREINFPFDSQIGNPFLAYKLPIGIHQCSFNPRKACTNVTAQIKEVEFYDVGEVSEYKIQRRMR